MRHITFILLFVSLSVSAQIKEKLRAHYSFEESSTAFVDSINSHDATIYGSVTNGSTSVKLGDYGDFPGSSGNYAELDTISLNNKTFTISAWVYIATAQGNRAVIGRWYGQTMIATNSGGTQWNLQLNTQTWSTSAMPVTTGAWKHLVWTYDGNAASNNVRFYINGSNVFSANFTEAINNNGQNWQIGSNGNNSYNFLGKIDELSIWDRTLSSTEVDSIYNTDSPSYPYQWTPTSSPASQPTSSLKAFLNGSEVLFWSTTETDTVYAYKGGFVAPVAPPTFTGGDYYLSNHADSTYRTTADLEALISQLEAGDTVMLEKGSVFYEAELDFNSVSGTESNPIVFMAYGTGADPIISGNKNLTGGFSSSGNIWTNTNVGYTKSTNVNNPSALLINETFYPVAKYPDNSPYLASETESSSTYFDDFPNDMGWTQNEIVGAQVVARVQNWRWFNETITANNGSNLTFTSFPASTLYDGEWDIYETHYFLQNHDEFLSRSGEWTYDNNSLKIYHTADVNSMDVEMSVVDILVDITNSDYIYFNDIEFRGANQILVNLQGTGGGSCDYVTFDGCTFSYANVGIDMDYANNCDITNSTFEYIHLNGITMEQCGATEIEDNAFRYITVYPGMENVYDNWSSAIFAEKSNGELYIQYNTFDTIFQAFQTHDHNNSLGGWHFNYNTVNSYGWWRSDGGAWYANGDFYSNVTKELKHNIILNVVNSADTDNSKTSNNIQVYTHAFYSDLNNRNIAIDSNLVVNSNAAFYSNRAQNIKFRGNNVYDAAYHVSDQTGAAIVLDQVAFDGWYVTQDDTITGNLIVSADDSNDLMIMYQYKDDCVGMGGASQFDDDCTIDWGTMVINSNKYYDPFNYSGDGADIVRYMHYYNNAGSYNLSEWTALTGKDASSSYNTLAWNIDSVSVDSDDFVKYVYNATKATAYVEIGDTATYYDIDGSTYSDSIQLESYKHKILFFKEE